MRINFRHLLYDAAFELRRFFRWKINLLYQRGFTYVLFSWFFCMFSSCRRIPGCEFMDWVDCFFFFIVFTFFLRSQLLTQKRRLFSFKPQTFRFSANFSRFAYMQKSDFLTGSRFAFVKKQYTLSFVFFFQRCRHLSVVFKLDWKTFQRTSSQDRNVFLVHNPFIFRLFSNLIRPICFFFLIYS